MNDPLALLARHIDFVAIAVAVDVMYEASLSQGVADLIALCTEPGVRERCVASTHKNFSLDEGVEKYALIYTELEGA